LVDEKQRMETTPNPKQSTIADFSPTNTGYREQTEIFQLNFEKKIMAS
jgi:hypothetical protein